MNVIVIGGGASGLMAAITAAKGGHSVTLLERQARVGRKLLSTGNGRCNLTNLNMGLPYYHGQDAAFIRPAFEALSLDATLDFFHGLGLLTTAEDNGRVYPYSDQAGSVVDVLRFAADPRRVRGDGPEENKTGVHRPLRRGNPPGGPGHRLLRRHGRR